MHSGGWHMNKPTQFKHLKRFCGTRKQLEGRDIGREDFFFAPLFLLKKEKKKKKKPILKYSKQLLIPNLPNVQNLSFTPED